MRDKVDVRSARAVDPGAVREVVQSYSSSTPVLFSSVRATVLTWSVHPAMPPLIPGPYTCASSRRSTRPPHGSGPSCSRPRQTLSAR